MWWLVGLAPAAVVFGLAVRRYGPVAGYGRVLPLALAVAVGVLGVTAVFIAWFPAALERAGLRRLAAWLRTWWDEDAR